MGDVVPFNPLDKINLAASIVQALSLSKPMPLKDLEKFNGAGVYSLYYTGDFPAYESLARTNRASMSAPIYVGKADAKGKRKGGFLEDAMSGTTLWKRLCDHAASIESASNLDIEDFTCRFLVVDDLWISLGGIAAHLETCARMERARGRVRQSQSGQGQAIRDAVAMGYASSWALLGGSIARKSHDCRTNISRGSAIPYRTIPGDSRANYEHG